MADLNRRETFPKTSFADWQSEEQTAGLCDATALLDAEFAVDGDRGRSQGDYSQESIISCNWDSSSLSSLSSAMLS